MVGLKTAKQAVASARDSIDTSMRVSIGALVAGVLALILSMIALARARHA